VRVDSRKVYFCSGGSEARKEEALFLTDVTVESRNLCSCFLGCEAREQEALFLPDVSRDQEAVLSAL
jgi:hypothetical protein